MYLLLHGQEELEDTKGAVNNAVINHTLWNVFYSLL